MFEMDDVELVFTSDSLDAIAAQAIKRDQHGGYEPSSKRFFSTRCTTSLHAPMWRVVIDRDVVAEGQPTLVPARSRRSRREVGLTSSPISVISSRSSSHDIGNYAGAPWRRCPPFTGVQEGVLAAAFAALVLGGLMVLSAGGTSPMRAEGRPR